MLGAIALLLATGGAALFWVTDSDSEPLIQADGIGELCDLAVNEEMLAVWADVEQERVSDSETSEELRTFSCLYAAEYDGDDAYRLVTFLVSVQVYESQADARQAHSGVLDFEAEEGNSTTSVDGVGERADLSVHEGDDDVELHLYAQESNATVALNLFLTGQAPEGADGRQLAEDLVSGLLGALPEDEL